MNLPDAFDQIKKTKHDSSFESLNGWLDQNTSKPKKMKTFYKIAASFVLTAFVLIACSLPVQHEEEIGFMIKGISSNSEASLIENMKNAKSEFGKQVVMNFIVIEGFSVSEGKGKEPRQEAEVILMLPNANVEEANAKMDRLNSIFNFDQMNLMPIEEEVEVPLYQAALSQVNLNFGKSISEEVLIERFNKVLHENSTVPGKAKLNTDAEGNKYVEIIIEDAQSTLEIKNALNNIGADKIRSVKISKDKDGNKVIDLDIKEDEIEN
jgi:hypothetical protein